MLAGPQDGDLEVVVGADAERAVDRRLDERPVVAGDRGQLLRRRVRGGDAEDRLQPLVRVDDGAGPIELQQPAGQRLGEAGEELLSTAQRLVRRDLVGDVDHVGRDDALVRVVEEVVVRHLEPDPAAVAAAMAHPDAGPGRASRQHRHPASDGGLLIVGMDDVERAHPDQLLGRPAEDLLGGLVDRQEDRGLVLDDACQARRRVVEVDPAGQRLAGVRADQHADVHPMAGGGVEVVEIDIVVGRRRQVHDHSSRSPVPGGPPGVDDRLPVVRHHEVHRRASRQHVVTGERQRRRPRHEDPVVADGGDHRRRVLLEQRAHRRLNRRVGARLPHHPGGVVTSPGGLDHRSNGGAGAPPHPEVPQLTSVRFRRRSGADPIGGQQPWPGLCAQAMHQLRDHAVATASGSKSPSSVCRRATKEVAPISDVAPSRWPLGGSVMALTGSGRPPPPTRMAARAPRRRPPPDGYPVRSSLSGTRFFGLQSNVPTLDG